MKKETEKQDFRASAGESKYFKKYYTFDGHWVVGTVGSIDSPKRFSGRLLTDAPGHTVQVKTASAIYLSWRKLTTLFKVVHSIMC